MADQNGRAADAAERSDYCVDIALRLSGQLTLRRRRIC
jgi:hypothetical protein